MKEFSDKNRNRMMMILAAGSIILGIHFMIEAILMM